MMSEMNLRTASSRTESSSTVGRAANPASAPDATGQCESSVTPIKLMLRSSCGPPPGDSLGPSAGVADAVAEDTSSEDHHMIASDDKVGPPTSLGLQCRG